MNWGPTSGFSSAGFLPVSSAMASFRVSDIHGFLDYFKPYYKAKALARPHVVLEDGGSRTALPWRRVGHHHGVEAVGGAALQILLDLGLLLELPPAVGPH